MSTIVPFPEEPMSEDAVSSTSSDDTLLSTDLIIIDKILSNELLNEKVQLWNDKGVINLIHPEWKKILFNNPVYIKHQTKHVTFNTKQEANKYYVKHTIQNKDDQFQVLVAGIVKVIPNTAEYGNNGSVVIVSCAPIDEIGRVMCHKTSLKNCKFYVNTCGGICPSCRPNSMLNNMWCLQSTQVFTKEGIRLATREYAEAVFGKGDIAIMLLEITMSYDFSNMSKIGGNIKSICFIQEALLRPNEVYAPGILTVEPVYNPFDIDTKKNENEEKKDQDERKNCLTVPIKKELEEPMYEVNTFKL